MDENKRKELFAKRKYFSEHPDEAIEEYCKRDDGISTIPIKKKEKETVMPNRRAN